MPPSDAAFAIPATASEPRAERDERGWLINPLGPHLPFGSALPIGNPIETPALITERVRKLRGSPACPECGNRGPWQCACPDEA